MSEEEKRTKKQKIEDNRRLRAVSQTMHPSSVRSSTPPSSPSIVPETEYHQRYPTHFSHDDDDDDSHAGTIDDASSENVFPTPTFDYRTLVDDHDARRLRTIENNYQQAVRLNVSVIEGREHSSVRHLQRLTDLVNELAQMSALRMITFFKLTPEFNVCYTCPFARLFRFAFRCSEQETDQRKPRTTSLSFSFLLSLSLSL